MKKTKKDIEKGLQKKYLKRITNTVRNKYRRICETELKNKEFYFEKGKKYSTEQEISAQIMKSYEPLIEQEIKYLYENILNSDTYQNALINEEKLQLNRLHYKNLKEYQRFPIHAPEDFINDILNELIRTSAPSERPFSKEEVQYLTLITLYGIIDYIRQGFEVKIGTCLRFLSSIRDIRINLPDEKIECSRILEDRIIPKVKLCKEFGRNYFMKINENNQAIINYYKEKTERFLILIRGKNKEIE
jgi:hypothetical protein